MVTAICIPDNDAPGRKHVEQVAFSLHAVGIDVSIATLPEGKDVSDYLDAGHSVAELQDVLNAAPAYEPPASNVSERTEPLAAAVPNHLTDTGNARRFAQLHRGRAVYCFPMEMWFVYDGKVWRADEDGAVMRLAKQTVASIYDEASNAPDSARSEIAKWALKSEGADRLNAMIGLVRSELAVKPNDLDADRRLLNCQNGTLDLRTHTLRPHRAEDYLTKITPVPYDPDARSELWERVITKAMPDAEARRFMQKAAGMTLDGQTDDVLLVVFGETRTAKGTVQEALSSTLGDYAMTGELDLFAERDQRNAGNPRPELVRLKGARMVSIYETSKRLRLSASLVKTATDNDPITARALYSNPITFKPEATIWIATNHRPNLPPDDEAIWERVRELPFNVTIPREQCDPNVRDSLRDPAKHGTAILAWMVEGHRLWRLEGLPVPKVVQDATESYRAEMNKLKAWVDECCVLKAEAWTRTSALRDSYGMWCMENHERNELSTSDFSESLRQLGCTAQLKHAARGWSGIGLIDDKLRDCDRGPLISESVVPM